MKPLSICIISISLFTFFSCRSGPNFYIEEHKDYHIDISEIGYRIQLFNDTDTINKERSDFFKERFEKELKIPEYYEENFLCKIEIFHLNGIDCHFSMQLIDMSDKAVIQGFSYSYTDNYMLPQFMTFYSPKNRMRRIIKVIKKDLYENIIY